MWFKCKDKQPHKDGVYLTVEHGFMHSEIYRVARFRKNLGTVIGLEEYHGKSGFYDSDSEWGAFIIKPEAWKYIEKYRG